MLKYGPKLKTRQVQVEQDRFTTCFKLDLWNSFIILEGGYRVQSLWCHALQTDKHTGMAVAPDASALNIGHGQGDLFKVPPTDGTLNSSGFVLVNFFRDNLTVSTV